MFNAARLTNSSLISQRRSNSRETLVSNQLVEKVVPVVEKGCALAWLSENMTQAEVAGLLPGSSPTPFEVNFDWFWFSFDWVVFGGFFVGFLCFRLPKGSRAVLQWNQQEKLSDSSRELLISWNCLGMGGWGGLCHLRHVSIRVPKHPSTPQGRLQPSESPLYDGTMKQKRLQFAPDHRQWITEDRWVSAVFPVFFTNKNAGEKEPGIKPLRPTLLWWSGDDSAGLTMRGFTSSRRKSRWTLSATQGFCPTNWLLPSLCSSGHSGGRKRDQILKEET